MKVIQVCKENECDKNLLIGVEIGDKTYNYCCRKGFEKSVNDFSKTIKPLKFEK